MRQWSDKTMHASLTLGGTTLMGADVAPHRYEEPKGFFLSLHIESLADSERVFDELARDGYIARPDGDLEWLTSRPAPEGFYGMNAFMRSIDTKLFGRRTYEASLRLVATFDSKTRNIVFSRHAPPADAPSGVEFVNGAIGPFVRRLREHPGRHIWLMGGGDLIASFLDENAIDEFLISVVPVFIGDGIPVLARRHRHVPLDLQSVERFEDGVVQLHYRVLFNRP